MIGHRSPVTLCGDAASSEKIIGYERRFQISDRRSLHSARRRSSAKKLGYETPAQSESRMRVGPEAARPATAKAMAMR